LYTKEYLGQQNSVFGPQSFLLRRIRYRKMHWCKLSQWQLKS
jgi:hypothetical protein